MVDHNRLPIHHGSKIRGNGVRSGFHGSGVRGNPCVNHCSRID